MTDPLILQRLTSARLVDLLTEVLTTEARMAALGQLGADIRAELNHRGDETYQRDGMAPTWRADDKLGTISYSVGRDAVVVVDRDEWLNWAAQQHPDEVTASIEFPAAALPFVVELLSWAVSGKSGEQVPPSLSGWRPQPQLTAREAWQKGFLEKHTTVIEPDQICNADGQLIPGLAQRRVGRVGVSVRLNPELKARAIAELGDPATFALLTAPIGEVTGAHPEPDLEADGEPDYDGGLPPVPLHPVQAAAHAIRQGGFSTPAIEAFRILRDAMRCMPAGGHLDARWRQGVLDTLAWLDDQADAEVDGEEARFAAEYPGDWRAELLAAARRPVNDESYGCIEHGRHTPAARCDFHQTVATTPCPTHQEGGAVGDPHLYVAADGARYCEGTPAEPPSRLPLETMTKPELQELARRRGVAHGGTKADLVARIRQADGDLAGAR